QFAMNASMQRSFDLPAHMTGNLRFDATNVLNHVAYTAYNTLVGSPQFGVPAHALAPNHLPGDLLMPPRLANSRTVRALGPQASCLPAGTAGVPPAPPPRLFFVFPFPPLRFP